jgi:hypothetical protein
MVTESKHARTIRAAHAAGYRVDEVGQVTSPRGLVRVCSAESKPYPMISLGQRKHFYVHKFAAYQWFGDAALTPDIHVRHLDGNPSNNERSNLALGTPSQNAFDIPPAKRRARSMPAASARRVLTPDEAREIVTLSANGWLGKDLAVRFGVSKSTISEILSGKLYSDLTGVAYRARVGGADRRFGMTCLCGECSAKVRGLAADGFTERAIARQLSLSRALIVRVLGAANDNATRAA